ncbi:AAA family ATPase [Rhodopila sp.]|uniref:AAA family ATPase n=1 Tax=Rhodopila sp. TaxID=2480087 RepID=UPI003D133610
MLIVFGGLPGTGKSTIARLLAGRLKASYVRVDTIEQALRACGTLPNSVVTEGYAVAYRVAEDNLRAGNTVIADSVNPLAVTRDAWLAVASRAEVPSVEVEVVCSDANAHRRRLETRTSDVPGLVLPTWDAVQWRDYEPWNRSRIVLDTASRTPEDAVECLLLALPGDP